MVIVVMVTMKVVVDGVNVGTNQGAKFSAVAVFFSGTRPRRLGSITEFPFQAF